MNSHDHAGHRRRTTDSHHAAASPARREPSNFGLALSATIHCLIGCGVGEVLGVVIGTATGMAMMPTMVLAVVLGFIFGFVFGMYPLLKARFTYRDAFRQVLIAEGLSIAVMETFEVLVQIYMPGVMEAGLGDSIFWIGMLAALAAGFIAAFPVNMVMVARGIRHRH